MCYNTPKIENIQRPHLASGEGQRTKMTTATYDPVAHMTTLDCPYGCGAKLVADETYVGNATCLNDSPRYYSDRGDLDEC